jgi:hypothetical protein
VPPRTLPLGHAPAHRRQEDPQRRGGVAGRAERLVPAAQAAPIAGQAERTRLVMGERTGRQTPARQEEAHTAREAVGIIEARQAGRGAERTSCIRLIEEPQRLVQTASSRQTHS